MAAPARIERSGISNRNLTQGGAEGRSQNQRVTDVRALDLERVVGPDHPVASIRIEQPTEH